MIKHIVMWKLKDFAEGKSKEENAKEIKTRLENLNGKIAEAKAIEVGINTVPAAQAFDVVLCSEFENLDDLGVYAKHPEHVKVVEYILKVVDQRVAVDYQV